MENKPCENRECPGKRWVDDLIRDNCNLMPKGKLSLYCRFYHANKQIELPVIGKGYRIKGGSVQRIVEGLNPIDTHPVLIDGASITLESFWSEWEPIT